MAAVAATTLDGNAFAGLLAAVFGEEMTTAIGTCASCHREEDCMNCHSAEPMSMRASPHPKGWRGSAKCKALDSKNRRMCLRCHITQDELGCDWRAN